MGRKSLKETRQKQIIKAFYRLAKKEGLENASIAKTADLLKINPSLVIHYFKTREHLVYGLVEYILDRYLLIFNVPGEDEQNAEKKLLAVIDNIFSHKWDLLFDDSVSYSCYSLSFRNKIIRRKYKLLLDSLRENLEALIITCNKAGYLRVTDTAAVADLVFVLVDGAYYYLSLVNDKKEYETKLETYKKKALELLYANS